MQKSRLLSTSPLILLWRQTHAPLFHQHHGYHRHSPASPLYLPVASPHCRQNQHPKACQELRLCAKLWGSAALPWLPRTDCSRARDTLCMFACSIVSTCRRHLRYCLRYPISACQRGRWRLSSKRGDLSRGGLWHECYQAEPRYFHNRTSALAGFWHIRAKSSIDNQHLSHHYYSYY